MTSQYKQSKVSKITKRSRLLMVLIIELTNNNLRRKKHKSSKFSLLTAPVKVTGECTPQIELIAGT
jgi:hypothetical protein